MSYKKKKLIYLVRVANGNIYQSLRISLVIQVIMSGCHWNFRKTVYIGFCYILQFGRATYYNSLGRANSIEQTELR